MDMAVTIQTRDSRPPSKLFAMLSSTRVLTKSSNVFRVRLSPPLTRSAKDLWRLDTAEKYVRGEEALGSWRPRGISVVEDYDKLISMERRAADVQAIRVILDNSPAGSAPMPAGASVWGSEELVSKALSLWQKRFGSLGEVIIFHSYATTFALTHRTLRVDCPEPGTGADRRVTEVREA